MVRFGLDCVSARAAHGPNVPERRREPERVEEREHTREITPRIRGNEREITVSLSPPLHPPPRKSTVNHHNRNNEPPRINAFHTFCYVL